MDINKGRLIPDVHPLSYFSEENARSPFEGELCVDRSKTSGDICFWYQDVNNIWHCSSRTKEIQEVIDTYKKENVFDGALVQITDDVIRRFYYDQEKLECWLDESFNTKAFTYYAIKTTYKIKGKLRYVTGDGSGKDNGLNYENALIPLSDLKGKICDEIVPNKWYTVEFYDENKKFKFSLSYSSYQTRGISIESKVTDRSLTGLEVKYDQVLENGNAFIYKGQSVDDIGLKLVLRHADGHKSTISGKYKSEKVERKVNTYPLNKTLIDLLNSLYTPTQTDEGWVFKCFSLDGVNEITREEGLKEISPGATFDFYRIYQTKESSENRIVKVNFDKVDSSKTGKYELEVQYKYILSSTEEAKVHKTKNFNFMYYGQDSMRFKVSKYGDDWNNREYTVVKAREVMSTISKEVKDFQVFHFDDYDEIEVPVSYFESGRNIVSISYEEINKNPKVEIPSLVLSADFTLEVIENKYVDIAKFVPIGYLEGGTGGSLYHITLRYFGVFDDGSVEDLTEKVQYVSTFNNMQYGTTQRVVVKYPIDSAGKIFKTNEFNVFCQDPTDSQNSKRVKIGDQAQRVLFYDGSRFIPALNNTVSGNDDLVTINSLKESSALTLNGIHAEEISVYDATSLNKPYCQYAYTQQDLAYNIPFVIEKNISPKVLDTWKSTFESLIKIDEIFEYTFETDGYSFDGVNKLTSAELNENCEVGKLTKVYLHYKRNQGSIQLAMNKPLIVVGHAYDENGRKFNTGIVQHYAMPRN